MKTRIVSISSLVFILLCSVYSVYPQEAFLRQTDIFVSGTDTYNTFRIPAITVTQKGTILAFCEGRKTGMGDTGDIDMVLKRSFDGGNTWDPLQLIWDDGRNVCGNPCVVTDKSTGTIFLLMTHNLGTDHERMIIDGTSKGTRTVWVTQSSDDGKTWTKPKEITSSVKEKNWTWYATGPGVGIQLKNGRMVIPCDHMVAGTKEYFSHVFCSDDHGKSWKLGGSAGDKTNECQVVELADGTLLLNMRNYSSHKLRAISYSKDGGRSWSPVDYDPLLYEPICQASFIRFTGTEKFQKNRLLFSNPASNFSRVMMTVRLSYDEGKSWAVSKVLHAGNAAYSCLTVLPNNSIACLYERGENHAYGKITFAVFNLAWLTNGKDTLTMK